MIIGIDVGGSTTKIVGVKDGEIRNPMFVTAKDPVTSLFGAFGKYIYDHSIQLSEVEQVMLTGVGSSYIQQPLYGLPTARTDEFIANGLSAQYATGLDRLMVVSMGTGTSFVKVEHEKIRHVGGIGIGGGTLMGLSRLLLHTQDILWVSELAGRVICRMWTCRFKIFARLLCPDCHLMPRLPYWVSWITMCLPKIWRWA